MSEHIIVCPFCSSVLPFTFDFDSIHKCDCGACYKVCSLETLEKGVQDIAGELWTEEELEFIHNIPVDVGNIVVERDFETLLNLSQSSGKLLTARFCKYDSKAKLSLVWVKRFI